MELHQLDALLDSFVPMGIPGFDCAIARDGEVVYRRFDGLSDREAGTPMNGRERYNVYSCSKPLTCAAALALRQSGAFRLDDPLADYLPEYASMNVLRDGKLVPAQNRITIRHLFTMTAGFTYDTQSPGMAQCFDDTDGACPTREVARYLAREPLSFEPGTNWQYGLGHDVLAALVEVVSGMPFDDYVRKTICRPLGMEHTTYLLPMSEFNSLAAQYAVSYYTPGIVRVGKAHMNHDISRHSCRIGALHASGGGGCATTVDDMMRFAIALCESEDILSRETIREMATDQLAGPQRAAYWNKDYGYGLGVRCPRAGDSSRKDFGWDGAAGAYFFVDREEHLCGFFAEHVLNPPNAAQTNTICETVRRDLGLQSV
ncbi:MAG: serine hydrolase domain-containing protein [Kiritimatiellia bacterium]|jgi:CubicO group peptidase (beta-lactamase class C family)